MIGRVVPEGVVVRLVPRLSAVDAESLEHRHDLLDVAVPPVVELRGRRGELGEARLPVHLRRVADDRQDLHAGGPDLLGEHDAAVEVPDAVLLLDVLPRPVPTDPREAGVGHAVDVALQTRVGLLL
jgi:hypothetical protein